MRTVVLGLIAGAMVLAAMPACARACCGEVTIHPEFIPDAASDNEILDEPARAEEALPEELFYTEADAEILAKLMWSEAGGIESETEQACVAWTVLNRLDSPDFTGGTVAEVVTAPGQFYYLDWAPVTEELYALALDVLDRWNDEKNGGLGTGRVLPATYFWYAGDGSHNYFRDAYRGGTRWNYSLESPYDT